MDSELDLLAAHLLNAASTRDVFGVLSGSASEMHAQAKAIFRQLVRKTHPDGYPDPRDQGVARGAFVRLTKLWGAAEDEIQKGTYGSTRVSFGAAALRIKTRKREYAVGDQVFRGEIANLYQAMFLEGTSGTEAILKIARKPVDNDLLATEARALRHLFEDTANAKYHNYLPQLLESFIYQEEGTRVRRQVNAFRTVTGLRMLKDVVDHYPAGLDPRDMAWMWRRLLTVLGLANASKVVHGAITPDHILIQPEQHGLVLVDWCYSVIDPTTSGEHLRAVSQMYKPWYPPEVFDKDPPLPGLDIYLGAKAMVQIMGGDPVTGRLPASVPQPLQAFFKGCLSERPRSRPQDGWRLLEEFDELIVRLYGPRKFRPFSLPS